MPSASARRLQGDDGYYAYDDANNANGANGANDDVHYVNMTPNILSGILFMLFFTAVTLVGTSCLGQIEGQEIFVSKLPPVGREA